MVNNSTHFDVNYAPSSDKFRFGYQKVKWGPLLIRKTPNGLRDIVSELIISSDKYIPHGQSAWITGNYLTCWI
jgi:hypothetical protein